MSVVILVQENENKGGDMTRLYKYQVAEQVKVSSDIMPESGYVVASSVENALQLVLQKYPTLKFKSLTDMGPCMVQIGTMR